MTSLPETKRCNDCGTVLTVYNVSLPWLHFLWRNLCRHQSGSSSERVQTRVKFAKSGNGQAMLLYKSKMKSHAKYSADSWSHYENMCRAGIISLKSRQERNTCPTNLCVWEAHFRSEMLTYPAQQFWITTTIWVAGSYGVYPIHHSKRLPCLKQARDVSYPWDCPRNANKWQMLVIRETVPGMQMMPLKTDAVWSHCLDHCVFLFSKCVVQKYLILQTPL